MRHPNITQLMGVAINADEICIVTEFIARGSLFRILHLPHVTIESEHVRKFALDCCVYYENRVFLSFPFLGFYVRPVLATRVFFDSHV